ncbi:MAG: carbohydrate ABC transporter permease [Chloroflexota bacterium]
MATRTLTARRPPINPGRVAWRALFYALVVLVCVVVIFPVYWMIVSAIQPARFSMHFPPPFVPQVINLTPFQQLFRDYPVVTWVTNSTIISLLSTVLCLTLGVIGAYTLSCLRWRGRTAFGILLFFTQMLPEALIIIPIFIILRQLRMLENLPAVSLVNAAFVLPIAVWILKGVFDAVPREIREAALVDGCDAMSVLWRIVVPLSLPGLVAVGVVAFFYAWNEFLFTSTMLTTDAVRPAAVGLASLRSMMETPVERILAASMLFSAPPVLFYLVMQRYIVSGLTAGAVKG